MTLDELLKQTTPLPWGIEIGEQCCFHQGNRVSIMRQASEGPDEDDGGTIAEVWPTDEDLDIADGKLITHCVNHFGAVVEALERLFEDWVTLIGQDLKEENADVKAIWKKAEDALAAATNIPDMGKEDRTHLLRPFRVTLKEDRGDKFTIVFDCQAEDDDHAEEQAMNAYPDGEVVNITKLRDMGKEGEQQ
jgi:hypothetical protein